jgi:hypothetical protein
MAARRGGQLRRPGEPRETAGEDAAQVFFGWAAAKGVAVVVPSCACL